MTKTKTTTTTLDTGPITNVELKDIKGTTESTTTETEDNTINAVDTDAVEVATETAATNSVNKNIDPYYSEVPEDAMFVTAAALRTYTEQLKTLVLDTIMPVGFLYISLDGNHPTFGTWEDVSQTYNYRSFWVHAEVAAGTQLSGALPTLPTGAGTTSSAGAHTHTVSGSRTTSYFVPTGSYYGKDETTTQTTSSAGAHTHTVNITWSGGSDIYGKTTDGTVRPTCVTVHIFKRTA